MRILLVEDTPSKASLISKACKSLDATVEITPVSDLNRALEHIAGQEFDLVLLDMAIPETAADDVSPTTFVGGAPLQGKLVLDELRLMRRPPAVVVISGWDTFGAAERSADSLRELWKKEFYPFFRDFLSFNDNINTLIVKLAPYIGPR